MLNVVEGTVCFDQFASHRIIGCFHEYTKPYSMYGPDKYISFRKNIMLKSGASIAVVRGEESPPKLKQRYTRTRSGCERCRAQHRKCESDLNWYMFNS